MLEYETAMRKSFSHRGWSQWLSGWRFLPIFIGTGYMAIKKQIIDRWNEHD